MIISDRLTFASKTALRWLGYIAGGIALFYLTFFLLAGGLALLS